MINIPLVRSTFTHDTETRAALAAFCLSADRFSMGDHCLEFERQFAAWQNRRHAVLVNSGSSANLILIQALLNSGRLHKGARVGFSAITWATSVMPLIQLGLVPVPIDVEPATLNVMSYHLEDHLASLDAFFVTNALGFCGDLDAIRDLCAAHDVLLIEDNCESTGTVLKGEKAGNFGLASTFSLYISHHLTAIEGGLICTDDSDLADMLRMTRAHGWDRSLPAESQRAWRTEFETSDFEARYTFYDLAYNVRPTELTGVIGLAQMAGLDDAIAARETNYKTLEAAVWRNPELLTLDHSHLDTLSAFCFPVVCKHAGDRARYLKRFTDAGIEARPLIAGNLIRQPFWQKYNHMQYALPGADRLHYSSFYITCAPDLTPDELATIGDCLAWGEA